MKTFRVCVEQNGGEYEGWIDIETETKVVQKDDRTITFDGTIITFDENIIEIEEF